MAEKREGMGGPDPAELPAQVSPEAPRPADPSGLGRPLLGGEDAPGKRERPDEAARAAGARRAKGTGGKTARKTGARKPGARSRASKRGAEKRPAAGMRRKSGKPMSSPKRSKAGPEAKKRVAKPRGRRGLATRTR
jgi:hypothetical protein